MKFYETFAQSEADLRAAIASPVHTQSGEKLSNDLTVAHFTGKHTVFCFLNQSDSVMRSVEVAVKAGGKMFLADCDKKELYRFPRAVAIDNGFRFSLDIQPRQVFTLVATKQNVKVGKGHLFETLAGLERKYRIVFKNKWDFRPNEPNLVPLTFWNMRLSGNRENGGFYRFLETYLEVEDIPKTLKLILNGIVNIPTEAHSPLHKQVEIAINGVKVKEIAPQSAFGEPWWTPSVPYAQNAIFSNALELDIAGMVHKGFNRISIRMLGNCSVAAGIDYPLHVSGDFALKRGSRGWILCSEATVQEYTSWTENGYPYFSGAGTYSQTFERPDTFRRLVIKFKKIEEIATVKINGQVVSVFPYEPMEIDVTTLTFQGKNEIAVQVQNTIDNAVKLNGRPSGLVGEVFLDVY